MKNMNEENINERIERVIKSVASKKCDMAIWNTEKAKMEIRNKRKRNVILSAAASVAVIIGVGIGYMMFNWKDQQFLPLPDSYEYSAKQPSSVYSSESSDIEAVESLLASERYEEALDAIETIMADTVIDPTLSFERKKQIRIFHEDRAYALEWIRIRTLIKLDRKADALDLLNLYVEKAGTNQHLAKQLQKDLNNK